MKLLYWLMIVELVYIQWVIFFLEINFCGQLINFVNNDKCVDSGFVSLNILGLNLIYKKVSL